MGNGEYLQVTEVSKREQLVGAESQRIFREEVAHSHINPRSTKQLSDGLMIYGATEGARTTNRFDLCEQLVAFSIIFLEGIGTSSLPLPGHTYGPRRQKTCLQNERGGIRTRAGRAHENTIPKFIR
jgi:hypothetical protein